MSRKGDRIVHTVAIAKGQNISCVVNKSETIGFGDLCVRVDEDG